MKLRSLFFVCVLAYAAGAWAEDVYIQVRSTKLRAQPKSWARGVADLRYGDKITLTSEAGTGWIQATTSSGKTGYLSTSAISTRKIVMSARGAVGVDREDVVLAGKGFNNQVEQSLKSSTPSLNFRAVDQMEQFKVSPDEIRSFIAAGNLEG